MESSIIKSQICHPGDLTEMVSNYNKHDAANINQLAASRKDFGQYKNIVVWSPPEDMTIDVKGEQVKVFKSTRYVIAGNGMHQAYIKEAEPIVWLLVDLMIKPKLPRNYRTA